MGEECNQYPTIVATAFQVAAAQTMLSMVRVSELSIARVSIMSGFLMTAIHIRFSSWIDYGIFELY